MIHKIFSGDTEKIRAFNANGQPMQEWHFLRIWRFSDWRSFRASVEAATNCDETAATKLLAPPPWQRILFPVDVR